MYFLQGLKQQVRGKAAKCPPRKLTTPHTPSALTPLLRLNAAAPA
jgi:hypothetical protein